MKNNVLYIAESPNRYVEENVKTLSLKYPVKVHYLSNSIGKIKDDFQIIIQHTKPIRWEYLGDKYKNVGVLESRCENFNSLNWINRISLLPKRISHRSYFLGETVIPIGTDSSKYMTSSGKITRYSPNFTFYTISSPNRIDNLSAIIKAFHLEFRRSEPVDLAIFIDCPPEQTLNFCNKIKSTMRLYNNIQEYKKEIIISDKRNIHLSADCFIGAKYETMWDFNAFDAMCYGKTPIVNNSEAYTGFINELNGYIVKSKIEPSFGIEAEDFDVDSSYAKWYSIDVLDLKAQMRRCYKDVHSKKQVQCFEDCLKFDYSRILPLWEKVIENG